MKEIKRYQHCNKFIKILRNRWMLLVPFYATYLWISINLNKKQREETPEMCYLKNCFRISIGTYQGKMHFYYTMDEMHEMLKNKFGNDLFAEDSTDEFEKQFINEGYDEFDEFDENDEDENKKEN